MSQLSKSVVFQKIEAATAAGTSDITSDTVDMQGFEGVVFIAHIGTLTGSQVTSMKVQSSSDDSTYNDLLGTDSGNMDDTDGDQLIVIDIHKPLERYLQAEVLRGTANAVINGVIAIKYGAATEASTQGATVFSSEDHVSPIEGTA